MNYGEPGPIWHSRVLLAHAGDQDWAILTPDHDVYIETMANENPDLVGFYYCGEGGVIPPGVNPADVYAFRPLTPAQLGAFRIQGEALAVAATWNCFGTSATSSTTCSRWSTSGAWSCCAGAWTHQHLGGLGGWRPFEKGRCDSGRPKPSTSRAHDFGRARPLSYPGGIHFDEESSCK